MKNNSKRKVNVFAIIVFVVLILYAISIFFVLGWGLLTSLKTYAEFRMRPNKNVLGLPDVAWNINYIQELASAGFPVEAYSIFNNYQKFITSFSITFYEFEYDSIFGRQTISAFNSNMGIFVFNSFLYAFVGSLCRAIVNFVAAYVCSKYKYKFSPFMVALLITTMAIPLVGTSVPTLDFVKSIGIYGKKSSIIIMSASLSGMHFLIFHAFLSGLSNSFIEAAEIDGASQFSTLVRVVFPLSSKVFFTVFLLLFVSLWNDYSNVLLFYPNMPTLSVAMYELEHSVKGVQSATIEDKGIPRKAACCMVVALPLLIIFVAFRNVIMGNVSIGGVKE